MNVREMYNYGYKWTGMIPLTAEEARSLFLNDSIQIYRLYQDNILPLISILLKKPCIRKRPGNIFWLDMADQ